MAKKQIAEWRIYPPVSGKTPKTCIIALSGRGNSNDMMQRTCQEMALDDTLVVCLRGSNYQWYPQPISSTDQDKAVAGLPAAREAIDAAIKRVEAGWKIKRDKIAIVGYSAGGVMALEVAGHSKQRFAAVVSFCGAILQPSEFPACDHPDMPVLLIHNQDDTCFDWKERYLPMRKALLQKKYNLYALEQPIGGHMYFMSEVIVAAGLLAKELGYGDDWQHPRSQSQQTTIEDDPEEGEAATESSVVAQAETVAESQS